MDVLLNDATPARPVPLTGERALTELVRCRRFLDSAVESLELAVEIFARLNEESGGPPLSVLEDLLGKMEEAEASLRSATAALPEPVPAGRSHV